MDHSDFTKEELIIIVDAIISEARINSSILDDIYAKIKLERFKLTSKLSNGIEVELDNNLLYLDPEIDLDQFAASDNFGQIVKFISTNSFL